MKRTPWSFSPDGQPIGEQLGIPGSFALIPEDEADLEELRDALEDAGVQHSLSFRNEWIAGSFELPANLTWDTKSGGIPITIRNPSGDVTTWFWIVEVEADSRKFAWFSLENNPARARAWGI